MSSTVYRVLLKAKPVRVVFDDKELECGFFKTEFVWASDREQAISKARRNALARLIRDQTVNQEDVSRLYIEPEEVEAGAGLMRLLSKHGFVFHRLDENLDESHE
jgi:hypothetical protein